MKTFVTFGQTHTHSVNGKTLDKDTVAIIESRSSEEGRRIAFQLFDRQFCFEYPEDYWDESSMKHFPKGYVAVN